MTLILWLMILLNLFVLFNLLKKKPKISAITVSFNSVISIRDTIEGILSQDYNNIEYVIIDARSKDGSAWTNNKLNEPLFVEIKKSLQKIKQFFLRPKI